MYVLYLHQTRHKETKLSLDTACIKDSLFHLHINSGLMDRDAKFFEMIRHGFYQWFHRLYIHVQGQNERLLL